MRSRQEIAKRIDTLMDQWRVVNANFAKTPCDDDVFHRLKELNVEINTLLWVLDMNKNDNFKR